MVLLGQVPGTGHVLIVTHAVSEVLTDMPLVTEVHFIVVDDAKLNAPLFGKHDIVKADAIPLRAHV